jgi:biotin synthase
VDVRNDWTLAEVKRFSTCRSWTWCSGRSSVHRRYQIAEHGADQHPAQHQDGRLPGGLRLLPAERALRHRSPVQELLEIEAVAARARAAKDSGATRFCMGAAYRSPKPKDLRKVAAMIREVKSLGSWKPAPRSAC